MKNLKTYIKDYIVESAWDIEDNIEDDNKELVLNEVKKFINDNYINFNIKNCEFIFDEKKNKYVINCNQQVTLKSSVATQLTNDLFEWGTVWNFNCTNNDKLTSLKGAPKEVGAGFSCSECLKLKSLEGAPETVGGNFYCRACPELKTLQGAPKTVGGSFNCKGCPDLTSLKGAPKTVEKDFDCYDCPNLHSLDGIGKVKGKIFSDIG